MASISAQVPVPASITVATGTHVGFLVTDVDGIEETSISVALDAVPLMYWLDIVNDANLTATSNVLTTSGSYAFTPSDVGRTVFIKSGSSLVLAGVATVAGTAVTGTGTQFLTYVSPGDFVRFTGDTRSYEVASVTNDLAMVLVVTHPGVVGATVARELNSGKATITGWVSSTSVTTNKTFKATEANATWFLRYLAPTWSVVSTPNGSGGFAIDLSETSHLTGSHLYTATLGVYDQAGNPSNFSWVFTTTARPTLFSVNPISGDPFGRVIQILFSEVMLNNGALVNGNNYTLTVDSGTIPAISSISQSTVTGKTRVDIRYATPLTNNANYTVTANYTGLFSNTTGNQLQSPPGNHIDFIGYGTLDRKKLLKTTIVNRPLISGPDFVDFLLLDANTPFTFDIVDLDVSATSVLLGPSAVGVSAITSFTNNSDGTGEIQVVFSRFLNVFKLSIIVIDNVDNASLESNILGIGVLANTIPGTELKIRPLRPLHGDTYDRMLRDIPVSNFQLHSGFVIPYTTEPYPFVLDVVDINIAVFITVTREGPTGRPESSQYSVIPEKLQQVVMLSLGRGRNYIAAVDGTRKDFIVCSATTYATIIDAQAQEINDFSVIDLDEMDAAIKSPLSTRLAESVIPFGDLLTGIRPQQVLATKLAINAFMSLAGKQTGVETFLTAVTLQTPFMKLTKNDLSRFEPSVYPMFNPQEHFSGMDAHVWLPNNCVNRWMAFSKYVYNFHHIFTLIKANESEVSFLDENGQLAEHTFDSMASTCSSLDGTSFCFDGITIDVSMDSVTNIEMCAASYPFDLCYNEDNPMGAIRGNFDSGVDMDAGVLLDENNYLDPGNDGWVGFCFLNRLDSFDHLDVFTTDGSVVIGTHNFVSVSHYFSMADVGKYIRPTNSGLGNNILARINTIVDSTTAVVDIAWTATEGGLTWQLEVGIPFDTSGPQPNLEFLGPSTREIQYYNGSVTAASPNFTTTGHSWAPADVGKFIKITNSLHGNNGVAKILSVVDSATVVTSLTYGTTETGLHWQLQIGYANVTGSSNLFTVPSGYTFTSADVGKAIEISGTPSNNGQYVIIAITSATSVRTDINFPLTQINMGWILRAGPLCVLSKGFVVTEAHIGSSDIPIDAHATVTATLDIV